MTQKGNHIGRTDIMIAGVMKANGINEIITRNIKHFSKISDIQVITYSAERKED